MLDGSDLELVNSFRVLLYFEQMSGHSIDLQSFTPNDIILLFYAMTIASLQKARKDVISLLDFYDVIDNNGGEKCILDFSNFYVDIIKKQSEALQNLDVEEDEEDGSKKK